MFAFLNEEGCLLFKILYLYNEFRNQRGVRCHEIIHDYERFHRKRWLLFIR